MLKGCSVIVMDEATANVDFQTDAVIQVGAALTPPSRRVHHPTIILYYISAS